jgi:hypothetical protein
MILVVEVLLIVLVVHQLSNFVDKHFKGSGLVLYGLLGIATGAIVSSFSHFFDAPVFGLRYGVVPELGSSEAGLFVGTFMALSGLLLLLVYLLIKWIDHL